MSYIIQHIPTQSYFSGRNAFQVAGKMKYYAQTVTHASIIPEKVKKRNMCDAMWNRSEYRSVDWVVANCHCPVVFETEAEAKKMLSIIFRHKELKVDLQNTNITVASKNEFQFISISEP